LILSHGKRWCIRLRESVVGKDRAGPRLPRRGWITSLNNTDARSEKDQVNVQRSPKIKNTWLNSSPTEEKNGGKESAPKGSEERSVPIRYRRDLDGTGRDTDKDRAKTQGGRGSLAPRRPIGASTRLYTTPRRDTKEE
jgi:hypothetical protein